MLDWMIDAELRKERERREEERPVVHLELPLIPRPRAPEAPPQEERGVYTIDI